MRDIRRKVGAMPWKIVREAVELKTIVTSQLNYKKGACGGSERER